LSVKSKMEGIAISEARQSDTIKVSDAMSCYFKKEE